MNAATLSTYDIPSGDAGLAEKAKLMVRFAQEDVATPELRRHLAAALRGVPERDAKAEVGAIFNYIRRNVRFVQDPLPYTELIQRPLVTLDLGLGDCDDFSTLGAALLGAAGYDADLEFISTRPSRSWSHVYNIAYLPARTRGTALPFDSSAKRPPRPLGWEVPRRLVTRRLGIPVFGLSGTRSELTVAATPQFRTARSMNIARRNGTPQGVLWRQTQDGLDRVQLNRSGAPPPIRDFDRLQTGRPTPPSYRMYEPRPSYFMGHSGGRGRQIRFQNVSTFNGTRDPNGMPDYFAAQGQEIQNIMRVRGGLPVSSGGPSVIAGDPYDDYRGAQDIGKFKLPKIKAPSLPPIVKKVAGKIVIPSAASIQNKITAAAKHIQAEAVKVGHNPVKALKDGTRYYTNKVREEMRRAMDRLPGSPLKKMIGMLTLLPPPASFFAAKDYLQRHRSEVMRELPAGVRSFFEGANKTLEDFFGGKRSSLGAIDGWAEEAVGGVSGMSWSELKSKIARAWDQLSSGKKTGLIALLVVLLIIAVVIAIYASPLLSGYFHAAWAAIQAAFSAFANAIGWPAILAFFTGIIAKLRGGAGVPAIDPLPGEPGGPPEPPPPTQEEIDAAKQAEADAAKSSGPGAGLLLLPAAAAAALFLI